MDLGSFLQLFVSNDQVRFLVVLILANLVLGAVGSVVRQTFDLTRLSDYARTRLLPVCVVYAVAVAISWAAPTDPILGNLRNIVFATESAVMVALLLSNLSAFGINLPATLVGKAGPAPINADGGPIETPATVTGTITRTVGGAPVKLFQNVSTDAAPKPTSADVATK